jgi:hypothetical protein
MLIQSGYLTVLMLQRTEEPAKTLFKKLGICSLNILCGYVTMIDPHIQEYIQPKTYVLYRNTRKWYDQIDMLIDKRYYRFIHIQDTVCSFSGEDLQKNPSESEWLKDLPLNQFYTQ